MIKGVQEAAQAPKPVQAERAVVAVAVALPRANRTSLLHRGVRHPRLVEETAHHQARGPVPLLDLPLTPEAAKIKAQATSAIKSLPNLNLCRCPKPRRHNMSEAAIAIPCRVLQRRVIPRRVAPAQVVLLNPPLAERTLAALPRVLAAVPKLPPLHRRPAPTRLPAPSVTPYRLAVIANHPPRSVMPYRPLGIRPPALILRLRPHPVTLLCRQR